MENSTLFQVYLLTFIFCAVLTIGIIQLLNKGLKRFFENLSEDIVIAKFFVRLTKVILLIGGISGAMGSTLIYSTKLDINWLTLTWETANQIESSLMRLFYPLIILAIVFFILQVILKRNEK